MSHHLSLADKLEQALGYVDGRVVKDVTTLHDLLNAIIKHLEKGSDPGNVGGPDGTRNELVEVRLQTVERQLVAIQQFINEDQLGGKVSALEQCFHQVEDMKDAVRVLKEKTAELSDCVKWEAMQTVLAKEREMIKEELKKSIMDTRLLATPSGHEEMVESLKDMVLLREELKNLETFVRHLQVSKADREELQKLGDNLMLSGPRDSSAAENLKGQYSRDTSSSDNLMHIERLRSDVQKQQEELQMLKKEVTAIRIMKNTGMQDQELLSAASAAESTSTMQRKLQDENKKLHRTVTQLNENYLLLLEKHNSLEMHVAQLQEGKADRNDLLGLGGLLTHTGLKDSTTVPSADNLQHEVQRLGGLLNHTGLKDSPTAPPADNLQHMWQSTSAEMSNMQDRILQLQDESNKLHGILKQLKEELKQKQSHTDYLYSTLEVLDDKKADKGLMEMQLCTKADMMAVATLSEHVNGMFQHISEQMAGYDQNWQGMYDKLSMHVESKLNIELDPLKEQLEDQCRKLRNILKQLEGQAQSKNVAGLRKPVVESFHCISCDQPVDIKIPEPEILPGPSFPAFPYRKSNRLDITYDLDHVRKHPKGNKSNIPQEPLILTGKPQSVSKVQNFHYRPPMKVCNEMPTDISRMSTSRRMLA